MYHELNPALENAHVRMPPCYSVVLIPDTALCGCSCVSFANLSFGWHTGSAFVNQSFY